MDRGGRWRRGGGHLHWRRRRWCLDGRCRFRCQGRCGDHGRRHLRNAWRGRGRLHDRSRWRHGNDWGRRRDLYRRSGWRRRHGHNGRRRGLGGGGLGNRRLRLSLSLGLTRGVAILQVPGVTAEDMRARRDRIAVGIDAGDRRRRGGRCRQMAARAEHDREHERCVCAWGDACHGALRKMQSLMGTCVAFAGAAQGFRATTIDRLSRDFAVRCKRTGFTPPSAVRLCLLCGIGVTIRRLLGACFLPKREKTDRGSAKIEPCRCVNSPRLCGRSNCAAGGANSRYRRMKPLIFLAFVSFASKIVPPFFRE